ncbi:MAG: GNAT family N-acetyltransferase [Pseudomonadota bacterium]|nr:GNAT family N-acetyltransferase [Pseudomonadota bacterium]
MTSYRVAAENLKLTPARGRPLAEPQDGLTRDILQQVDISVCDRIETVESMWRALEAQGTASVYQRYEWVATSLETLECDESRNAFIVTGRLGDEPAFLLPLSIRRRVVHELTWVGGTHVNFNMGLFSPRFLAALGPGDMRRIMTRVVKLMPGVGYLQLCNQPRLWKGVANPMAELAHQPSINPAFIIHLDDGFEAVLARGNAKRKRKKFRHQCRAADAAGGHRLLVPDDPAGIDRVLEAFFTQKSERLAEQGITNVFGTDRARALIRGLAHRSIGMPEPLLRLHALEIGGEIRAVFGAGVHDRQMSGYFSSISSDDMTHISPGEMLLYMVVERSAQDGLETIDLGAGDERYKRSWCDERLDMFDVILPASVAGTPFAQYHRLLCAAKRNVRERPQLWETVSRLRRIRRKLLPV